MSSQVAFYYGGNLDNTKPFSAGAVYFDTVKKQIWYDDPSGKSTTHTLLTSLGEISEVTSLPSSAKHKDIVLLKTLVSDQTYTYQLNIYDEVKKSWTSLTKNIKDTDVIFTGTTSGSLTKGKNLSENISNLQSQLLTQLSGKEPTISLTLERAVVSNASGKLIASAVTSTELGHLSGVTSKIQTQLNEKAPTNHASTGTTYGIGTASQYGHLKLSDDVDSESDVTVGYAATPKAINTVYNLASSIGTQAANSIISLDYNNTTRVLTATKNNKNTATITLPIPSDSVFGLVKSGGDVTITNGVISVKDDSHNHIIDNIDGLGTQLSSKVSKTGDTMTGNLTAPKFIGALQGNANTATIANKVNITRPSKSVLEVAGDMALFSEEIYFLGSDGLLYGAPVNYVIINAKKGANHRTILDCYALQTGDHYINGCMKAQTGSTVEGANVWTGWVLQPNPASLNKKQDALMGTANRLLKSASDSKIAVSSIAITETTSGDTTTITFA